MAGSRPPKALVFDVFGTVVDWRSSLIRDLGAWGAERGVAVDWAALADAWRGAYQPSMQKVREGALPWTRLDDLHETELRRLVEQFGLEGLSDDDIRYLNHVWHRLAPWPDAVAGLTRLKQRFIIATLSNGNVALLANMAKRAGLPWDLIFSAELCRRYKPDPLTYRMTFELLDLQPAEVMMVAAHNGDLIAAAEQGLRTAFVRRATEYGPRQRQDLEPEPGFDYAAESIEELADQLGAG
ncbi:MAG: haloacid dehalogenase type II [Pseudomonadota bacterium]